ncbi:MAG: hypothetical protein ACE15E_09320 [Acidobacteriota bacterium]
MTIINGQGNGRGYPRRYMAGRYRDRGIGLPAALAASSQAVFAISASRSASSGVFPQAEQMARSEISAM